ncbi:HIT family hydrolase [Intrasporangium oryzae NRRL B-24470]|uniref:HIT family hydrolase n=1 Tax=Intrasporangium oryzae NRRL B-24470 TaxID=1386089 RepID=W9GF34_9MICO|nr:histidine triad nucleotide-binding protein [Intrasporangium oryzae]EWT03438.1 HIT family hydrolase [Intrasporangium oryzae NRRL B-24470]
MSPDACLFCRIVDGDIPSDRVAESERSIAFRDINPAAPVHVLVVPKRHEPNLEALAASSTEDLADVFSLVSRVAELEGVTDAHRLLVNTGAEAGQTIFHAHIHLLAGARFTEGRLV